MNAYVVGIDGSGPSAAALEWAVVRAAAVSAPVVLVHVIEDEWGLVGSDFAREAMFAGEAVLQQAQERALALRPSVALTSRIVHGSPVWELANACAPDDILVVGTHKTGFLQGRVLGSRSVSLAGTAPCAVVVVPVGRLNSRHGVVAGVVRADGMELAVAAAAREAARLREPLTLLHASPPRPDGAARDHDHDHESAQRALLRDAAAAAHAVAPGVEIHTRISGRKPVEALLDASRYATMLVLEPSRRTGPAVSMVGTTTHDVLMNINSPVLVARGTAV